MNAIVYRRYGPPEVLQYEQVEMPVVADEGVLVRVRAASVNAYDWHMMRGKPFIARPSQGLRGPKDPAMGLDAAGIVEAIGKDVTHVQVGDEVFGARSGAFAEFVAGRNFVAKPAGLSFEEAAAVPVAGCTALQALRDKGRIEAGQRVLVTGAGGGVGSFAVQIAKAYGATVTAVTSTSKVEMVGSIGADTVIDHQRGDFTQSGNRYDLVIDAGGYRSLRSLKRVIAPGGALVIVGPGSGDLLGPIAHVVSGVVRTRLGRQRFIPFLSKITREDLLVLKELIEAGKLRAVIDRTYPLRDVPEAIRHLESGRVAGKVVITV